MKGKTEAEQNCHKPTLSFVGTLDSSSGDEKWERANGASPYSSQMLRKLGTLYNREPCRQHNANEAEVRRPYVLTHKKMCVCACKQQHVGAVGVGWSHVSC